MKQRRPTYPKLCLCNTLLFFTLTCLTNTLSRGCELHSRLINPNTDIIPLIPKQQTYREDNTDNGATLTVGIIAGISVGGIALVIAIVILILYMSKRCKKPDQDHYQGFADWRKDRNLTSVEIARNNGKPSPENTVQESSPTSSLRYTSSANAAHV